MVGETLMVMPAHTDEELRRTLTVFEKCGFNVSKAARELRMPRQTFQNRLREAENRGISGSRAAYPPNALRGGRPFGEVCQARKKEFREAKSAGTFRTLHKVGLPDDRPFCVVILGDPHLDSPGTDLELWEKWIAELDRDKAIYGICLGDYLDNWLRVLGHIYGGAQTTVDDSWQLLEGYIDQMGDGLLASVSGNHDDWGEIQALRMLMERNGVIHRRRGLRLDLRTPGGHSVTIGLRHRFVGNSQWNAAHAVSKAAQFGWRDDILAGGDKHISGTAQVKDPDDGRITHCFQVAAFKVVDDYAEEKGFLDKHISPGVALVIDPAKPQTDPARVVAFADPAQAADYLKILRRQPKTKGRAKRR
jgi:hypothetical protein